MTSDASQPGFDPDGPAVGGGVYGLPCDLEHAGVVLIPVPWEATVSYRAGTAGGPAAILQASRQVDLFDLETGRPWQRGVVLLPVADEVVAWNTAARRLALPLLASGGVAPGDPESLQRAAAVDRFGEKLNGWVLETAAGWMDRGRLIGLVGGDHSSAFGLIQAAAARHPGLGVLQLDAHADLRPAYEGFRWSHASVFHNVLERIPGVARLVQVGVRDLAEAEDQAIRSSGGRVRAWFDPEIRGRLHGGESWSALSREMIEALPQEIHLSFDIDGLEPSLCPHTGTPVPGGLTFSEATSLLRLLVESGRRVVSFDLCEVAPDPRGESEWDGNVGARLLYKMIGFALRSASL